MSYSNFAELRASERENHDYRIEMANRSSPVSVFAIHGGKIETGTSAIARAIAGDDFNLYLFEGLKDTGNFRDLHLSSTAFDEPHAITLAQNSKTCVSIHGFKERERNWVALGGLNRPLRADIFAELLTTGLIEQDMENPLDHLHGVDPANIVNRCRDGGVQIEISYRLRRFLGLYPKHLQTFCLAVRRVLSNA